MQDGVIQIPGLSSGTLAFLEGIKTTRERGISHNDNTIPIPEVQGSGIKIPKPGSEQIPGTCAPKFKTMAYRILTATYTDRVETLLFDSEAKSLSIASSLTVGHHPSWITPHPENPAIWFTALEQEDGRVVAIEYNEEGKGKVVGEVSSEGAGPCTLVAYKGDLLIGNVSYRLFLQIGVPLKLLTALIGILSWIHGLRSIRAEASSRSP